MKNSTHANFNFNKTYYIIKGILLLLIMWLPILGFTQKCKESKSLKIIDKALSGKAIHENESNKNNEDYRQVKDAIECVISANKLSGPELLELSNQFKNSGLTSLKEKSTKEGTTRMYFAQKLSGAAFDKCTSDKCRAENFFYQGVSATAKYYLLKDLPNQSRMATSSLQLGYIQLRKALMLRPNIENKSDIKNILATLESEAPYLSSYTGQVYTGEAIGGGPSIQEQILAVGAVLAIAATATGAAVKAYKSSIPLPSSNSQASQCRCAILSIKDEGWIISNGYSTVKFENGKTANIKYEHGKYKVMGWFFNDYYKSYSEMLKKLVEECKTEENCY